MKSKRHTQKEWALPYKLLRSLKRETKVGIEHHSPIPTVVKSDQKKGSETRRNKWKFRVGIGELDR